MTNQERIPCLTLVLAQQGGIGYPPIIVKLDRWYAVDDSRERKVPKEIRDRLEYQKRLKPYGRKPDKYWHPQQWVWNKWYSAPRLTWDEVAEKAGVCHE